MLVRIRDGMEPKSFDEAFVLSQVRSFLLLSLGCVLVVGLASPQFLFAARQDDAPQTVSPQDNQFEFSVGSEAPDIDIENWISNNDGLFPEIKRFENYDVYVLVFWATHNTQSQRSLLTISRLQTKYEIDDVQFIAVTKEKTDLVEQFLGMTFTYNGKAMTYRALTNNFCLTSDSDGSVYRDFVDSARQKASPLAMLIGRTRQIEWIGDPQDLVAPLDAVIEGNWDQAKFKLAYETEILNRENRRKFELEFMRILTRVHLMMRDEKDDEAFAILTTAIENKENGLILKQLQDLRMELLISRMHFSLSDGLQSYMEYAAETLEENPTIPTDLNNFVWKIYERQRDQGDVDSGLLKVCLKGAKFAVGKLPDQGVVLDTYAHLIYLVEQDLDKAIKVQEQAVESGGDRAADLKPFLEQLKQEKAGPEIVQKEENEEPQEKPKK